MAASLMHWGVFGTVPDRDPGYSNLLNSIAGQLHSVHAFTESDGFHGDGTDWYELDLSANLAEKLRRFCKDTPTSKTRMNIPGLNSAPSWWPKQWPADCEHYERHSENLMLPATGMRIWFT